jgi:hypothetical protein
MGSSTVRRDGLWYFCGFWNMPVDLSNFRVRSDNDHQTIEHRKPVSGPVCIVNNTIYSLYYTKPSFLMLRYPRGTPRS